MPYTLVYTKSAVKDISRLDLVVKKQLKKKLEQYQRRPLQQARKLVSPKIGTYRWRIGNYGVIFDIDQKKKNIVILRVRHRREVYSL